jgi:hypothetical protein
LSRAQRFIVTAQVERPADRAGQLGRFLWRDLPAGEGADEMRQVAVPWIVFLKILRPLL